MIAIIEAGSSKTDIAIIHAARTVKRMQFEGLNPVTDQHFDRNFATIFEQSESLSSASKLFFYGSGCVGGKVNERVRSAIQKIAPRSEILIEDDLLGACRGMCGHSEGIVGILGTGSNTCEYNGRVASVKFRSCGYLLGDEGSGYRLGQQVYLMFCRGLLNPSITRLLKKELKIGETDPVIHLYQHPNPRTFLAKFAQYMPRIPESTRNEIFDKIFDPYIRDILMPLYLKNSCGLYLTGSIAYHFKSVIDRKLEKFNIIAASIEKSPIEGLIKYHINDEGY